MGLLDWYSAFQRYHVEGEGFFRIGAHDFESAHAEALAFFDGDGDVDGLAVAAPHDQRNAEAITLGVDVFENGFADGHLEVTVIAIQATNADFQILAQLLAFLLLPEHPHIPEHKRDSVSSS